ncbi:MAG: Ig-like domain-containing protein, partial [Anaerolineae bacterium]
SDTTLRFTPAAAYQRGQRYQVTIAESARSAAGLPLNRPVELAFTTPGAIEVTAVQPADAATEIDPAAAVTVLFNRPVVPLTAIENQAALPQPLTFVPPVIGAGEWLNTSIYQFTPDGGFEPATRYTARVAAGLTAADGSALEDDFTWRFTTASPKVVATYPEDDAIFVSPTSVISVAFNQLMDRSSVEAAFRLENTLTDQAVAGTFNWVDAGLTQPRDPYDFYGYYDYRYSEGAGPEAVGVETMAFTPAQPLEMGAIYTAQIGTSAQGRQGNQSNLEKAYRFSFTAIPPLQVVDTYPADGSTSARPGDNLEITFSAPVNPATFRVGQNVLITPSVAVTRVYTYFWDSQTQFNLSFPTEASSPYTVTLGGSIESRYGQPLGEDVTIHWRTTAAEPMAFLHKPDFVGFYSAFTPTLAYVTVRNVKQVDFALFTLPETDFIRLNGDNRWRARRNFTPHPKNFLRNWSLETAPPLNRNAIYSTNLAGEPGATLQPGLYYLEMSVQPTNVYSAAQNLNHLSLGKQILVVSNYNMTVKASNNQTMAWLTDLRTTEPVAGAAINFRKEGLHLGRVQTDAQGVALAEHDPVDPWDPRFAFSSDPFAVAGTDWSQGVERWQYGLNTEDFLAPYTAHFYTDRAIYRPGQTVYFKGIIRADDDAHYTLPPAAEPVHITVYDGQGKEIYAEEYTLNENGTLNGQVELDAEAALGYYTIEARYKKEFFNGSFQVAEYRKPEFTVDVTTDKPEYANGDTILLTAQASYFFGGPVANAAVRYSILSEDYFFRYTGPGGYFDFTDYDFSRARQDNFVPGFGELIEEGTGVTGAQGTFSLEVSADIAERIASQRFTLEVVVVDSDSNQEVAGRAEAIVHKGDFYIGLRPRRYVGTAGEETPLNILTVDWHSQPAPGRELTIIAYEHTWYSVKVQGEDGSYYWDSVVEDAPVFTTTAVTGDDGRAVAAFTPPHGGVHKLEARGVDAAGNLVRSSTFMWVSGR